MSVSCMVSLTNMQEYLVRRRPLDWVIQRLTVMTQNAKPTGRVQAFTKEIKLLQRV